MANAITAHEVVNRIQKNLAVPWKESKVDGFQAGAPDTVITGIATSFAPTLEVLRRAKAANRNLIITREPALYRTGAASSNVPQMAELVAKDTTIRLKTEYLQQNNFVVWRFSENWQARKTDGQLRGLVAALGWTKYYDPDSRSGKQPYEAGNEFFMLPATTLQDLAKNVQDKLKIHGTRVIGSRQTEIRKVALSHGLIRVPELQQILKEPSLDAIVIGEPVEWEASPYFQDIVASGQKKGMIIIGQAASEDGGSSEVAAWLRTFISEVPIEWMPAGEPFWVPS